MSEQMHISENGLDALLNTAFLEMNAVEADLSSANFILSQEYHVRINAQKEQQLLNRLRGNDRGGMKWNLFLSLVLALLFTSFAAWYLSGKNVPTQSAQITSIAKKDPVPKETPPIVNNMPVKDIPFIVTQVQDPSAPQFNPIMPEPSSFNDVPYLVGAASELPIFTEKQLSYYTSMKNLVLDKLFSLDKELYTKIEEGSVPYKDGTVGVDAFVIRKYAITNLEYKAFLADMMKDGRVNELGKVMVRNQHWSEKDYPSLGQHYFSDTQYDAFPVVNITREGAMLFCQWLEKEMNASMKEKDPGARKVNVRLPYDHEWIYAARAGYAQIPDCGGYNTIFDPSEGLVDKTFVKRMEVVKKHNRKKPTYADQFFGINRYGMDEKEISEIFDKGLRYQYQYATDTIYPGGVDVFSKTAHVSEIIQNTDGKTIIMGSCWNSKEDYKKLVDEFKNDQGSPFIGFRVVITNASKGTYKDPFW